MRLLGRSSRPVQFFIVLVIAAACTIGFERAGWIDPMESVYYDYWHQFAQKRRDPVHTAVVAVDDVTLLEYQQDPLAFWAPYWAHAMDTLDKAGVRAIGLDFIYTVSAEAWLSKLNLPGSDISRNYDSPLRAQLAAGNKILITHLVDNAAGEAELLLPPQDQFFLLPGGINDLGIANLYPDSDKLVRRFFPVFDEDPKKPGVSFGMQLALRAAGADPQQMKWVINGTEWERERRMRRIGYVGPPGTVPTVSMVTLLKPDALSRPEVQALKGRTVIIAANNAGTSDRHFTPYSRGIFSHQSDQMTGGEIHANIIETILSGAFPRSVPAGLYWAYVLLWVAGATVLFLWMKPTHALAAGVALGLLLLAPAYWAFLQEWILPVGAIHTGMSVAFLATLGLRLTGEEKERARLKQMFGRYVSDDVVDTLLADADRPDLAGEERHVTVLFSDIRNFTTISEKLDAHEVVQMLNAYFSETCEPILQRGGMVNKYIGDAVMAVFGAPKSYPDHARRALAAALDMVEVGKSFQAWMQQHFPDRGLPPFAIGVGLHTGTCVVGDIGSAKRTEFTAIGDTVNAASRLEGVTKELGVWLCASAATIEAAGPGVRTGKRETVTVKGRAEPIEVFEVVALEPK